MTEERERSVVFGEAVELYEATRPDYPAQLAADVVAYAPAGPLLEVGAGTGKATRGFAGHGRELTCRARSPDRPRRRPNLPDVAVVVSRFEDWTPDREYAAVFSAQAWHWVDPERRNDLAHAVLAPGGALALFWNLTALPDTALHAALGRVDTRHGLAEEHKPHAYRAEEFAAEIEDEFDEEWKDLRLGTDPRFTDLTSVRYRRTIAYRTGAYLDLLRSISLYRMLEPEHRERILADIAATLDDHGGAIELVLVTDLALARRAS